MEKMELICQVCKNGCKITVEYEDGEVWTVDGNGCMKGMIFAQGEVNRISEP